MRPPLLILLSLVISSIVSPAPVAGWASFSPTTLRRLLPQRQHRRRLPRRAGVDGASSWSPPPVALLFSSVTAKEESIDEKYYSASDASNGSFLRSSNNNNSILTSSTSTSAATTTAPQKITLTRWLADKVQAYPELRDMESLHLSIQMACKTISNLITTSTTTASAASAAASLATFSSTSSSPSSSMSTSTSSNNNSSSGQNISMKRLDQICKNVLQNALRFTGRLRVVEAPDADNEYTGYHPRVIIAYALDDIDNRGGGGENSSSSSSSSSSSNAGGSSTSSSSSADSAKWGKTRRLAACFDPLDGSGNADADICTGTVVRVLTVLPFWIGLFSLDTCICNPRHASAY
jgi:hypothetical protein